MELSRLSIQREILLARVQRGGPPDTGAGLLRGAEVDRLVEVLTIDSSGVDPTLDGRRERLDEVVTAFEGPLARARDSFAAGLAGDEVFATLTANARLDQSAAEVMALAAAVELDPVLQRLVGWLHDDPGARRVSLGLIGAVVGDAGLRSVSPDGRLVRAGYVQDGCVRTGSVEAGSVQAGLAGPVGVDDPDGAPAWAARPVVTESALLWALMGERSRDPDLPLDLEVHVGDGPGDPDAGLVVVHGGDRWRRREAAIALAPTQRFLVAPAASSERGWRALVREATIRGCGLVIELDGPLGHAGRAWVERADHLVWVLSSATQLPLDAVPRRRWRELEAGDDPAGPEEWAVLLPGAEIGRHPLSADQIRQVARALDSVEGDLDAAVRRLASGAIDRLARRVRPRRTWADLVLPATRRGQLQEVVARYRHRARVHGEWGYDLAHAKGVVALFHGPSGTGKTLSAEIIANDLGLDLFRIDLSAMVSKYIGETEKNLEELFAAASAANVVLLFDEADSLFGKRSEVNEAKDRYANIEVSYLLQRIENYDGVVILTTNLLKNIDQAFLRRIDVLVEFALPERDERLALWRLGFPPAAPLHEEVDLETLAERFKLAGGNIHSVTLGAAFLAAEGEGVITTGHVIEALGREYTKLGRLRTAEEFGAWLPGPG